MPFCKRCGAELKGGETFCPYCGEPINGESSTVATAIVPSSDGRNRTVVFVIIILLVSALAGFTALTSLSNPPPSEYEVTVTFDEIVIYTQDGTLQTVEKYDETSGKYYYYNVDTGKFDLVSPPTWAYIYFELGYNNEKYITDYTKCDFSTIDGEEKINKLSTESHPVTQTIKVKSSDKQFSMFVCANGALKDGKYSGGSTIDAYEGDNGVSGILFEFNKESETIILTGDAFPYCKLTMTVTAKAIYS